MFIINTKNSKNIIYIATDGGCKNNGKSNCIASYSFIIIKESQIDFISNIIERLKPCISSIDAKGNIKYIDNDSFQQIILTDNKNIIEEYGLVDKTDNNVPTHNRGELTAMLKGLTVIQQNKTYDNDDIILVSDSEYSLKAIDIWSRNWKKNPIKYNLNKKANTDLIFQIQDIIDILRKNCNVSLIHVRSHVSSPIDPKLWILWYINERADKLCNIALGRIKKI